MRPVRRKRKLSSEINVVPYIDIMLVLMVVFMVTAPLFSQGYQVDLPDANAEPIKLDSSTQIVISVDIKGDYYYNAGEENELLSLAQIQNRLQALSDREFEVFIRGDSQVNYGAVISLMANLRNAGIDNVGLVTQPRGST